MEQGQTLSISWESIIKLFVAIFVLYFIYLGKEIVLWFLFGLAISVLLEPAINILRIIKIPKIVAIILVYFSIFGALGLLIYLTAPAFIFELKQFSQYLPGYFNQISPFLQNIGIDLTESLGSFTKFLVGGLQESSKGVLNALMAFFGGISSTAFILAIAFFISLEDKALEKFLVLVSPKKYEDQIAAFFTMAQSKVAGWFGARILACLFVGIGSFIVFYIFGIKYALMLALVSAFLNFIPYIGPLFTFLILTLFILVSSGSWLVVMYVLISIVVVQMIENWILTPLLMKKMINIPPVLVLISLVMGAKLFGFLGAIFAVPVCGIFYEFIKELLEKKKQEEV
ncbi:MAG: AI-2E family transporter [Candidatus Staskawiczbacteria bacterium]